MFMRISPNKALLVAARNYWVRESSYSSVRGCETGLDDEKGYRITRAGRDAYKAEMALRNKR
jgi:hypothetical protein